MMKFSLKSPQERVFSFFLSVGLCVILVYWGFRLSALIGFDEEETYIGSLGLFLLSWIFIFGVANVMAWLNFNFLYSKWKQNKMPVLSFWTLELLIFAAFYEFLLWRTSYDVGLMGENFLVLIFLAAYFVAFIWIAEGLRGKKREKLLLQQKERAELLLLQSQLNPHFLFNALNSIYSKAIKEGSENTAEQIQGLAVLMRFAIEKANQSKVSLQEELEFLNQYIQIYLNRLSPEQQFKVEWNQDWDGYPGEICPMLIQPLIENGFKFSDFSANSTSTLIRMVLKVEENDFKFTCENYYISQHVKRNKGTGKGMELVAQRLKNLYPEKHKFEILEGQDLFKVKLHINLN
ncbi:histidine kinase [Litoribacter ruber]|uniref:sensor histidine kinase n=1 Tax=Litoribacter ruber TaxID=702568 RepID=UPI001BDA0753|nr:histidine kinase [Litoribacter ruber]MBT0809687.1 histidine kinase [Litoribacter ruber]